MGGTKTTIQKHCLIPKFQIFKRDLIRHLQRLHCLVPTSKTAEDLPIGTVRKSESVRRSENGNENVNVKEE
jgi:hypothetical protein